MKPRILCLDIGRRRIGVAVSDPLRLSAQPLDAVVYKKIHDARDALARVVESYAPVEVVVGLPLELHGGEGPSVRTMRRILEKLRPALNDIPVVEWDERMTTVAAERMLISGGVRRARRKEIIDSTAASLILQGYLGSLENREDLP